MALPKAPSAGEERLFMQLRALNMPLPQREHRFHPTRRWKFDFAWPGYMLAVEVEGMGGRHQTHQGFRLDLEKYHHAFMLGWSVYRCSSAMVKSGAALEAIQSVLNNGDIRQQGGRNGNQH